MAIILIFTRFDGWVVGGIGKLFCVDCRGVKMRLKGCLLVRMDMSVFEMKG